MYHYSKYKLVRCLDGMCGAKDCPRCHPEVYREEEDEPEELHEELEIDCKNSKPL